MPKAFSEKERREIVQALKSAAAESIATVGIKKTTVDDLVTRARIPKGTFYLFYASKELLIYDVLMDIHIEVHSKMAEMIQSLHAPVSADDLAHVILEGFAITRQTGLHRLMVSGEIDALVRKLPDEMVKAHQSNPEGDLFLMRQLMPDASEADWMMYSGAFTALFFSMCYQREIGAEIFDDSLALLVKGLCIQMIGCNHDPY